MPILVVSAMAQEELAAQLRDACSKTAIIQVLAVERKYSALDPCTPILKGFAQTSWSLWSQ